MNKEDLELAVKDTYETSQEIIAELEQEKQNLIKYLENLLTDKKEINHFIVTSVEELLEKVKSGNYE